MTAKNNSLIKWFIIALAIAGFVFNSGVLYNDVKHLKGQIAEIKQQVQNIQEYLLEQK